jgi:TetR/AcrR family transcriptional repressor of bet genes
MQASAVSKVQRRTAPPEQRRLQLIQATIRSIARNGLPDTTMATVAKEAGLSQGIINLHFKSKERLLLETLKHVVDEYRASWEKALATEHETAAAKLAALVCIDFEAALCDRDKLAVWFAFWGESKSRPTYRKLCAERDRDYEKEIRGLCRQIAEEGPYAVDPEAIAWGLSAMSSGLWLDLLVSPRKLSRDDARRMCMVHLAAAFPGHFGPPESPKPLSPKKTNSKPSKKDPK